MSDRHRLLELALKGIEAERAKIDNDIAAIKEQIDGRTVVAIETAPGKGISAAPTRKRRRMSAAARKKISEGMKRRYAAMRAALKK
jgi:hypothetical protein